MRKILLAILITMATAVGCKKDKEEKKGALEVKMSYYFNQYQGYKPDVNADIFLFKNTGKSYKQDYIDYRIGRLEVEGTGESVSSDFSAKSDASGTAKINDIPYGSYLLVATSKGRFVYSKKIIEINSDLKSEVKNFYYLDEFDDDGESW